MKKINLELTQEQLNSLIFVLGRYIDMSEITIQDPLGKDTEDKKELLKYLESKKTIQLTENTRQWLKLINTKDYKYITTFDYGAIWLSSNKSFYPRIEYYTNVFNIDLSMLEFEKTYLITNLLGDDSK